MTDPDRFYMQAPFYSYHLIRHRIDLLESPSSIDQWVYDQPIILRTGR